MESEANASMSLEVATYASLVERALADPELASLDLGDDRSRVIDALNAQRHDALRAGAEALATVNELSEELEAIRTAVAATSSTPTKRTVSSAITKRVASVRRSREPVGEETVREPAKERIDALSHQLSSAMSRWEKLVLETGIVPLARAEINRILAEREEESYSDFLPEGEPPGLSRLYDLTFYRPSVDALRLQRLLDRTSGAAIGVGGPRGSGKTSVIRTYCDPWAGAIATIHGRKPDLRVFISAPVRYEAKDFLLHVLATVCRSVIQRLGASRQRPERFSYEPLTAKDVATAVLTTLLEYALIAASAGFGFAAVGARFLRDSRVAAFGLGCALLVGGALIGARYTARVARLLVEERRDFGRAFALAVTVLPVLAVLEAAVLLAYALAGMALPTNIWIAFLLLPRAVAVWLSRIVILRLCKAFCRRGL